MDIKFTLTEPGVKLHDLFMVKQSKFYSYLARQQQWSDIKKPSWKVKIDDIRNLKRNVQVVFKSEGSILNNRCASSLSENLADLN